MTAGSDPGGLGQEALCLQGCHHWIEEKLLSVLEEVLFIPEL